MRVFSIPMTTRFRGITVREGVLLRGDAGWGEFSPFLEYDSRVAEPWLRAAREAADLGWPAALRTSIPVNVTVPAVDAERAAAVVLASHGCRTAKVKVGEPGQTLADDQARLEAVRDALGPDGRIRIDVNGLWSVDEAVTRSPLRDRAAGGLEYVEQPVASVEDLAVVRRRVGVPIAAGVALAAALPDLPFACGLATVQLLTDDVTVPSLLPVDGALPVVRPEVAEAALDRTRATPEREQHWRDRLAAIGSPP